MVTNVFRIRKGNEIVTVADYQWKIIQDVYAGRHALDLAQFTAMDHRGNDVRIFAKKGEKEQWVVDQGPQ
jgi:hypothetical protein